LCRKESENGNAENERPDHKACSVQGLRFKKSSVSYHPAKGNQFEAWISASETWQRFQNISVSESVLLSESAIEIAIEYRLYINKAAG
jgi:hypothetical protein